MNLMNLQREAIHIAKYVALLVFKQNTCKMKYKYRKKLTAAN